MDDGPKTEVHPADAAALAGDPALEAVRRTHAVNHALRTKFYSGDPNLRAEAVAALEDFCRCVAREHGLQLPLAMLAGCVPLYEDDFLAGKGKPQPDVRCRLRDRVWASPFAVPSPFVSDETLDAVLAKRTPEVAAQLAALVERATAAVLASQDRRIASLILSSTYSRLQASLAELLAKIPWADPPAPAVDGEPPA